MEPTPLVSLTIILLQADAIKYAAENALKFTMAVMGFTLRDW